MSPLLQEFLGQGEGMGAARLSRLAPTPTDAAPAAAPTPPPGGVAGPERVPSISVTREATGQLGPTHTYLHTHVHAPGGGYMSAYTCTQTAQ